MNITNIFEISLKGLRQQNEDKHICISNGNNDMNFIGLYDGHGGKFVSTFLYENLHNFFINENVTYPIKTNYIKKTFKKIHDYLYKEKFDCANNCGSTCLVLLLYKISDEYFVNVINVGDSRSVLCRNNIAIPLSKDHKPNWPEEIKRLKNMSGNIKFDGYDWRIQDLSVSRAFGDFDTLPYITNEPDIFKYQLTKYDKFIVMACDGLWDVMDNQEVVNFILSQYDEDYFYHKMYSNKNFNQKNNIAKDLAKYAINKGSSDNITIIIVFLNK